MMKITTLPGQERVRRFHVEGRVTHLAAGELRRAVDEALTAHDEVQLDFAGVTFADHRGAHVVRGLVARGATIVGCSGFLQEMLQRELPEREAAAESPAGSALTRLQLGDPEAFEALVREHGGRMLATARRMLRNEDDARDAVQEAFLSAAKSIGSFAGDAQLSTWLHRIVVNAALMKLRARRRRPEASLDDLLPTFDETGHWSSEPSQWTMPAHELLEQRDTRAIVRRCIEQLPETYRTVLMLRDIEDLDTEEVATMLGITPNAVKVRLHRARQGLRTLLDGALVK